MNKRISNILDNWKHIDKLIHLEYHEVAQKNNLTLEQFHVLIEIDDLCLDVLNEGIAPTVGTIAANIGNAPHTLSEKITRLEKKGLVEKIKDKNDLRISRVVLTDKGTKLIEKIKHQADQMFIKAALTNMDNSYLDMLNEGLENLSKILEKERGN